MRTPAWQRIKGFGRQKRILAAIFVSAAVLAACATGPPVRTDVQQVLRQPAEFKNERVELTGYIKDFTPAQGDLYRTLLFTLEQGPDERLLVVGAGDTAEAIAKASLLVEQAYEAQEPVIVVGKLKLSETAPPELRLESVRYKGKEIDITAGPRPRRGGLSIGGGVVTGSIGIGATITP